MKIILEVQPDKITDFPGAIEEMVQIDFPENAFGIGIRGWTVPDDQGIRFQARIGMSDWAAMQLLHLLQRYAESRGLKPADSSGPEPHGWHPADRPN